MREPEIASPGLFRHLGDTKTVKQPFITEAILRRNYMSTTKQEYTGADDEETKVDYLTEKDDIQRRAKFDLIIGFLRLFNFLSVSTSVFTVIISIYLWQIKTFQEVNYTFSVLEQMDQNNPFYPQQDLLFYLRVTAGSIQLTYLFVNAIFVIIDSIATVTFRWKEHGELTHRHTDATSILFLVSKSRWKQRFLAALTVTSVAFSQTTQSIINFYRTGPEGAVLAHTPNKAMHALIWYLAMLGAGLFSVVMGFLLYLIPADRRDVLWLDNYHTEEHIDDSDDTWKSFQHLLLNCKGHVKKKLPEKKENIEGTNMKQDEETDNKDEDKTSILDRYFTCFGVILEIQKRVIYIISYAIAITMDIYTFLHLDIHANSFEFWTVMISIVCNSLISLYLSIVISIQFFHLHPKQSTPFLFTLYVPFVLSSGLRLLLDVKLDSFQQYIFGYIYISLLCTYIFLHVIGQITFKWTVKEPINNFFIKFFKFNFFTSEGAYKKFVRVLDTMGSFFGLVGLLLGIFSLVCDQYDFEFKLQGDLKEMKDRMHKFYDYMKSMAYNVRDIIDEIDFDITCEAVHGVLVGGLFLPLGISLIPGNIQWMIIL